MMWSYYKVILNYGFHLKCFVYLSTILVTLLRLVNHLNASSKLAAV